MNTADKRRAWQHIKEHSPRAAFGSIELVSYRQIKNPSPASKGLSNNNSSLGRTTNNNGAGDD